MAKDKAKNNEKENSSAASASKTKQNKGKNSKSESKFTAFFKSAGKFLKDCKNEVKKIVWPTVNATFKNMGVVLVVIIIVGLFVFGLDTALIALLGQVMSVAG